jgi:hypothetical protein
MTEAQQGVLEPTPIQTAITAPSTEILQLWVEVGNGLEKSQTGKFLSFRFSGTAIGL